MPGARPKLVVVCGPTASGKSEVADSIAASLSEARVVWTPTVVVDSMQVYKEIPTLTNQQRSRPAELTGVVSVADEWTMARHVHRANQIIQSEVEGDGRRDLPDLPVTVLDAGTGMYLNATILDMPIAPRVSRELRESAVARAAGEENPRRAARAMELEMAGGDERGSIWEGRPRYDLVVVYLRPDRSDLDGAIAARSRHIRLDGREDARRVAALLDAGMRVNPSVLSSIGVKEMLALTREETSPEQAEQEISTRTKRLARRQMRWFDKLLESLGDDATTLVLAGPRDPRIKHIMHDTIGP